MSDALGHQTSAAQWRHRAAVAAILLIATFLRLWPIASGLPYSDYVDEGYILHQATKVVQEKTYDNGMYQYPSLPSYLVAAAVVAYSPVYRITHRHSLPADFPPATEVHTPLGDAYDLIAPAELIVVARAVVVVLSMGTVILTGLLAQLLAGRGESLVAMLLTAVSPALVSRASTVIVDTVATVFVVAVLCLCARLIRDNENARAWRDAAAAGALAGLAFVSKYPAGAVCAAIIVTVSTLRLAFPEKIRLLLASGAGFVVASLAAMPALWLKWPAVLAGWRSVAANYRVIASQVGYWGAAVAPAELGWPLVLAGFAGVALMLTSNRTSRVAALSWVAFGSLLLGGLLWAPFQPLRNLLPLVPIVCVGAAVCFLRVSGWVVGMPRLRVAGTTIVTVALFLLVGALAAESWRQDRDRRAQVDTRLRTVDWLHAHTGSGDRVLAVRELAILPAEWKRLGGEVRVVGWFDALTALQREHFDYLVTGEPDLRVAVDPAGWAAYRERWDAAISPLRPAVTYGGAPMFVVPYLWRSNDERIHVLRVSQ